MIPLTPSHRPPGGRLAHLPPTSATSVSSPRAQNLPGVPLWCGRTPAVVLTILPCQSWSPGANSQWPRRKGVPLPSSSAAWWPSSCCYCLSSRSCSGGCTGAGCSARWAEHSVHGRGGASVGGAWRVWAGTDAPSGSIRSLGLGLISETETLLKSEHGV